MISGVVLSAGRSRRMGSPKALLRLDGEPFLLRILRALRAGGCEELLVVLGDGEPDDAIAAIAREAGAGLLSNPDPDSEQIESLRIALRSLDRSAEAVVVTPVDAPGAGPAVVAALIERFTATGAPIAVPTFGGTAGHPTLFSRAVFSDLMRPDLPEGARSVVMAHRDERTEVPVEDPSILWDIDTPDAYRALGSRAG